MAIEFTQYLMPYGRKKQISFELDKETEKNAPELIDCGFRFDVEVLSTGEVSVTCEGEEEGLAAEICKNDPAINDSVKKLVNDAYKVLKQTD